LCKCLSIEKYFSIYKEKFKSILGFWFFSDLFLHFVVYAPCTQALQPQTKAQPSKVKPHKKKLTKSKEKKNFT
jgi:hypothetical protein